MHNIEQYILTCVQNIMRTTRTLQNTLSTPWRTLNIKISTLVWSSRLHHMHRRQHQYCILAKTRPTCLQEQYTGTPSSQHTWNLDIIKVYEANWSIWTLSISMNKHAHSICKHWKIYLWSQMQWLYLHA